MWIVAQMQRHWCVFKTHLYDIFHIPDSQLVSYYSNLDAHDTTPYVIGISVIKI